MPSPVFGGPMIRLRLPALAVFAALFGMAGAPHGANARADLVAVYAGPAGSGSQNGLRAGDAMPIGRALALVAGGGRPTRLVLAAGTYDIAGLGPVRFQGGRGPLVIEGAGRGTVLVGGYAPGAKPGTALFVMGRSDVTLKNFSVRNVAAFVDVPSGGTAERITISGVSIEDVHDGIMIDRGKGLVASDWRIEDVSIAGHARAGIRLAGARTTRIAIRRSTIDGRGEQGPSHCFKGGIQLLEAVSDVTIEDVTVKNNVGCRQHYQQGDGIEADDKQGAPTRITLRNVTSSGNRDGNFDLKAKDTVLEGLVSRPEGVSRYGFRLWHYTYACTRCRLDGDAVKVQLVNSQLVWRDPAQPSADPPLTCGDGTTRAPSVLRIERKGQPEESKACPPETRPKEKR